MFSACCCDGVCPSMNNMFTYLLTYLAMLTITSIQFFYGKINSTLSVTSSEHTGVQWNTMSVCLSACLLVCRSAQSVRSDQKQQSPSFDWVRFQLRRVNNQVQGMQRVCVGCTFCKLFVKLQCNNAKKYSHTYENCMKFEQPRAISYVFYYILYNMSQTQVINTEKISIKLQQLKQCCQSQI